MRGGDKRHAVSVDGTVKRVVPSKARAKEVRAEIKQSTPGSKVRIRKEK